MEQVYTLRKDTSTYTLKDIENEVKEVVGLLTELGYKMNNNTYKISLSTRRTKNFGRCSRKRYSPDYELSFNKYYIQYASPEHVHEVIAHEVIHSVPGCMNHGPTWKEVGNKLHKHYNIGPFSRLNHDDNYDEKYLKANGYYDYKYILKCDGCGRTWKYKRWTRTINNAIHTNKCTCPYCNGHNFTLVE